MRETRQIDLAWFRALVPVPLLVLTAVMIGLYLWGPTTSYESATLLLVLTFTFTTLISVFIAFLAGRSFLASGRPALLAICIAMILWGASALVAVVSGRIGNYNLTVHNLGLSASALCHLVGAFAVYRYGERATRATGAWLSLGIAAALCTVGAIWMSAQEEWLPPFYIEGIGATDFRTFVLATAATMFAAAAALTAAQYRRSGWNFLLWYSLGLALIAVAALGLILQPTHGSVLGWVARSSQYLGGVYMLVGTLITMRETGGWALSLEERLIRSEQAQREQADLIRTVNDNTTELIFMKDRDGRLTYANAATLRLLGRPSLADGTPDRPMFSVPGEHMVISDNDRRVMEAGQVIEVEEVFTGADGTQRNFLMTKSPLRDQAGRVIGVVAVGRDVTDQIVAREEIRRALNAAELAGAALRAADRRKDEFLAILAHELRNPLAPLRNMLEVMKRATGNEAVQQQAVGVFDRQLDQLVRLVDDLIDVSRITRNRIELRKDRVELASVVHHSIEACRPLTEGANQQINLALPSEPIYLHADPVRLAQVFGNLLNNACKYTEPGGEIWFTAEREGADVVVKVRDSGVGLPPDQLADIFELFTQVDRTLERSQGGLGIGLTLVKRLTEMHEGTVTAHSEGLGKGSEFVVRLPILMESAGRDAPPPSAETAAPTRRILVVDDNRDAASSLAMLLEVAGHTTQTAYDGVEAVRAAETFRPDVILLDIGLPQLNGYDACRRIREQSSDREILIVALTGWGQDEDRHKSRQAGFDHHMVKPIDYGTLRNLLTSRSSEKSELSNA